MELVDTLHPVYAERVQAVQAFLAAAKQLVVDRARILPALVQTTGLSPQGVEFALLHCLETDPHERDLATLFARVVPTSCVHVVLAAPVFTAALRALILARASAPRVVVRPSRRESVFVRALVETLGDPSVHLTSTLAISSIQEGELHVYGRDETLDTVRRQLRATVSLRAHGTGIGIALVTESAHKDLPALAEALAQDVVAFEQRGCLSPRVALVEGAPERARDFVQALQQSLKRFGESIPRGRLFPEEQRDAVRYADTLSTVGTLYRGQDYLLGLADPNTPLLLPPPGRHLHVMSYTTFANANDALRPFRSFVVAVGSNSEKQARLLFPEGVRIAPLGFLQRPPLDGPVDQRVFL